MTITADANESAALRSARAVGALAILTGIASLALLANHPGGGAHSFADVLKEEAANRAKDALVHGGFIAVLAIQLVCYAVFSRRLGLQRAPVIAGLVFFAAGTAFLSASMILDGFAAPAIAAKYLAAPNKIEFAKALFVLIGALISTLMPIGLAFQSAGIAAWGWSLLTNGAGRIAGILGLLVGGLAFAAIGATVTAINPLMLMGVMAATAIWAVVTGILLMTRTI